MTRFLAPTVQALEHFNNFGVIIVTQYIRTLSVEQSGVHIHLLSKQWDNLRPFVSAYYHKYWVVKL